MPLMSIVVAPIQIGIHDLVKLSYVIIDTRKLSWSVLPNFFFRLVRPRSQSCTTLGVNEFTVFIARLFSNCKLFSPLYLNSLAYKKAVNLLTESLLMGYEPKACLLSGVIVFALLG